MRVAVGTGVVEQLFGTWRIPCRLTDDWRIGMVFPIRDKLDSNSSDSKTYEYFCFHSIPLSVNVFNYTSKKETKGKGALVNKAVED
jgi:hypothetical protein